ncbi:MAG TPA: phospholipid carrier-dependent glycosyltransferase [Chloroflexota bacterium]|nr:phospholipid carrier-dependent glycosyltransferase [Chloroflexota bacterium]
MRSSLAWRIAFALLLAAPFFYRLDLEEFHGDESHWISSGRQAFHLFASGQFSNSQWQEEFYFYSQPQVGKLIIGAAQAFGGIAGPTAVFDYDWQLRPNENRDAGRVPEPRAIVLGRLPGAVAGWLSCLLLWSLATHLGSTRAGKLGAVLLASHPLWLANARRAGLDTMALAFGLACALLTLRAYRALRDEPLSARASRHGWWMAMCAGAALGLAVGTKYVGLLSAALGACAALASMRHPRDVVRLMLIGSVLLAVGAAAFIALNPALYPDPLYQLRISIDFLVMQAAGMRAALPAFTSPAWVALEMVDRAIWPIGHPTIVDRTLPEPLTPGSYGTPVVAIGAVLAVALMIWRPRRSDAAILAWALLVFLLLSLSIPTWWERWHLPLVLPLTFLAGRGLSHLPSVSLPRAMRNRSVSIGWVAVIAQFAAAAAMQPTFIGRGFGALAFSPLGSSLHVGALAVTLVTLVLLLFRNSDLGQKGRAKWQQLRESYA